MAFDLVLPFMKGDKTRQECSFSRSANSSKSSSVVAEFTENQENKDSLPLCIKNLVSHSYQPSLRNRPRP